MSAITLILLHPLKAIPVQHWTFDLDTTITIGRSIDNDVILYSAVVSRKHLEISSVGSKWELTNLGANGTYVGGKRVDKSLVIDGMIIRLASSGPQIKIQLDSELPRKNSHTERQKHSVYFQNKNQSKDQDKEERKDPSEDQSKDPAKDTIIK